MLQFVNPEWKHTEVWKVKVAESDVLHIHSLEQDQNNSSEEELLVYRRK
ncbi:MAG: hypothetical protein KDK30_04910 [Leptospiraceae bacterium]|nr:hypothetical protein [Leptospiraceae bacterium]MCB1316725.1 hypothetical protein [Leptospiraceae bacterium]MCB1320388.1 hypothetical protein [Leptospiraceae bacterium]